MNTFAQTTHDVSGTVVDSTKLSLPGSSIKLVSNSGDSTISIADANGKFTFPGVKGNKIALTISSIGFTPIKKHFSLTDDGKPVDLGNIILQSQTNMLGLVTIVGVTPVTLKEDTVEYNASAYKVRENAPAEDLIKKLPGVDVDVNGNITTQGKQVTKVRINGKDFMGGDVQSATKNLPADVIENIQMIDDYGDQANLTGIKTGEPDKIMNITIRKDKNHGYFGQGTVGDGEDALPASQGIPNKNRYIGSLNAFNFNGDQQIAILGSINNTNVNTFSFGSTGGGGGFGGGGGRGNAGRGGGNSGSLITTQNGITDAHSLGANFRDQWGKNLSVYGSYSFADNTVSTTSNTFQQNTSATNPTLQQQTSNEKDQNINHRFTWNMEYKPDTINYLKVTPTFSYAGTNTNEADDVNFTKKGAVTSAYTSITNGDSQAPNYGFTALFNHRFKHRRNLSITATVSSAPSWSYQNPVYDYTAGAPTAPANQMINTYSRTNSYGTNLSYLEPLGKRSYLELNYAFNHSITTNNKQTDTLFNAAELSFRGDSTLSNLYNYTFTTNRIGLNYRFIEKKYNYTLGLGVQPSVLDGNSPLTDVVTHKSTFNVIPTARFIYNFSRSQTFSVNYNGSSSAPAFTQLQPVIDFSNALYPVQGNPDLKPSFTNNFSIRYNKFSFATGNVFFANLSFQQVQNQVVTNTITFPRAYAPDTRFQNTILTQYLNADGYYTASGRVTYSKPWAERKYTVSLNGTATYTNNVGYLTNVDSTTFAQTTEKNIAKNLVFTPEVRFRVDITNVIDAQILTNYAINRTSNSVQNPLLSGSSNVRTWNIGLNGKNYFGDWTFSYDYSKANNYGYASNIQVTNPNILNLYVERRFLKNNMATVRLSGFDLFNQNTGFSSATTASSITQSHVNRLARYYLLTFTLRLQKFAGKAPVQDDGRGFRNGGGRREGGGGPGGGGAPGVPGGPQ
ncbi:outer membrane beta-barrel protein [Mucilaginibacter sp. SP1R1]|uniref:outer membrane beta-barrel protein n=1 Tax=Mucilaginibacter sp. SP1R1 TaxID=2723091 RepID=UPI00160D83DE|nr:outer membrane beta-barrel protein [Mucilaginibacter sp. SP1R1]MBB6150299.1 putative membrane protein YgcG [Mucilaginibacter sp. SP1R1]